MIENFREIPGFPRYKISSGGTVLSFTSSRHPEGKRIKEQKSKQGYRVVHLSEGTERGQNCSKLCHLHRLVAETYIPVPPELSGYTLDFLQVDHIIPVSMGGDIINPETGEFNLRWVTPAQNNTGNTLTNINREMGILKRKQKVFVYTSDLQLVHTFDSTADAARELGKSQGNIASCCTGALPRYLGWIWSYTELQDIKEREELEEKAMPQRIKNRQSINKAVCKYMKRIAREGKAWWQQPEGREISRQRSHAYYLAHREECNRKRRERYRNEQKTKTGKTKDISERILPDTQGRNT